LEDKPVEYRSIFHPSSSVAQGTVKLWVEINTLKQNAKAKVWKIEPKPPTDIQVRVSILNGKKFKIMDVEGTTDAFLKGYFTKEETQETDCHYRCQDGKPDFQYRLLYNIKAPMKDYKYKLQAYDRDFIKSNDLIGGADVNLKDIIDDVCLIK